MPQENPSLALTSNMYGTGCFPRDIEKVERKVQRVKARVGMLTQTSLKVLKEDTWKPNICSRKKGPQPEGVGHLGLDTRFYGYMKAQLRLGVDTILRRSSPLTNAYP